MKLIAILLAFALAGCGGTKDSATVDPFNGTYSGSEEGTQAGTNFTQDVTVTLSKTGTNVSGTWRAQTGSTGTLSGTVSGSTASLTFHAIPPCSGDFTGTFATSGSDVTGTISGTTTCGSLTASLKLSKD